MIVNDLKELINRDLRRLEEELSQFKDETTIWKTSGSIKNSPGHLTLHICGNLRHFIGHVLGGTSFKRDRDNEFSSEAVSLEELINGIKICSEEINPALDQLTEKDLSKIYPINVFKVEMTTQFFLIHLSGHLNYHLGQINYLRRSFD